MPDMHHGQPTVLTKLGELGISAARFQALQVGEPVIIFARKGAAVGSAVIIQTSSTPADEQELEATETITGRFVSGTMTSSVIGPAVHWESFSIMAKISELPLTDEYHLDVMGITLEGEETVLKTGLVTTSILTDIDATEYPFLKLVFHAADEINLTAPQLKQWLVEYTPAPEGVLQFNGTTDTQHLKEGETWTGSYGFLNISEKEFIDSLTVRCTIFNTTTRTSEVVDTKIKAPLPDRKLHLRFR
jgi:hypothetical protein